jgi:hypothetical protein
MHPGIRGKQERDIDILWHCGRTLSGLRLWKRNIERRSRCRGLASLIELPLKKRSPRVSYINELPFQCRPQDDLHEERLRDTLDLRRMYNNIKPRCR